MSLLFNLLEDQGKEVVRIRLNDILRYSWVEDHPYSKECTVLDTNGDLHRVGDRDDLEEHGHLVIVGRNGLEAGRQHRLVRREDRVEGLRRRREGGSLIHGIAALSRCWLSRCRLHT